MPSKKHIFASAALALAFFPVAFAGNFDARVQQFKNTIKPKTESGGEPAASTGTITKIRFIPLWNPQAQFAGYYIALKKGFYRKHGLDVEMLTAGPQASSDSSLEQGKADIALLWLSTALSMENRGVKLINTGQIVQKSALMLIAKKESGIRTIKDLSGRKISIWPAFETQPKTFFKRNNITPQIIPQAHSVNMFLKGGVDAACGMWYNEYHTIINSGLDKDDLVTFFPADYGVNFPEDGIYTKAEFFRKNRNAVCAFTKASVEGWIYAFSHPEEAVQTTITYMHRDKIPADTPHQTWMINAFKDVVMPQGSDAKIGVLDEKDYNSTAEALKSSGLIKSYPKYKDFFKDCENEN